VLIWKSKGRIRFRGATQGGPRKAIRGLLKGGVRCELCLGVVGKGGLNSFWKVCVTFSSRRETCLVLVSTTDLICPIVVKMIMDIDLLLTSGYPVSSGQGAVFGALLLTGFGFGLLARCIRPNKPFWSGKIRKADWTDRGWLYIRIQCAFFIAALLWLIFSIHMQ